MRNMRVIRIKEGVKRIGRQRKLILVPMIFLLIAITVWVKVKPFIPEYRFLNLPHLTIWIFNILMIEFIVGGLLIIFEILGTPIEAKRIEKIMQTSGFCDRDGCTPMVLSKRVKEKYTYQYEFYSPTISKKDFCNHVDVLRLALKGEVEVEAIKEGKNPRYIVVECVSSKKK